MNIEGSFILPRDVRLNAVDSLPDETRRGLAAEDGDVVLSRSRSRAHAKVLDAETAALIAEFTNGKTIVDAVLAYSEGRQRNPEEILDAVFPVLDELIRSEFLVIEGSEGSAPVRAALRSGAVWEGLQVLRSVQILDDSEVYQAKTSAGDVVALKKGRPGVKAAALARMLAREATILASLSGGFTPRVVMHGEADGIAYLVVEWCPGTSVARMAARLRAMHSVAGRHALLTMCTAIAETYADLHEQGVLHGDVHPWNILIDDANRITLLDFGAARVPGHGDLTRVGRGGMGYYYEPEYAAAVLRGDHSVPPSSFAGEQHVLAHVLYRLFTGHGYTAFSAARHESMRELDESVPEPFSHWGVEDWPDVEAVLCRALSRDAADRYGSVRDLAVALRGAALPAPVPVVLSANAFPESSAGDKLLAGYIRDLDPAGPWFANGLPDPPYASINYGSGGVAYFFYRLACIREDARLLSWAKLWIEKALQDSQTKAELAFTDPQGGELTSDALGRVALYHSPTGLHAVRALIAHAMGDFSTKNDALTNFATAARGPCDNIDVALGTSGVLLGAALLSEAMPGRPVLQTLGAQLAEDIWGQLQEMSDLRDEKHFCFTGIAHGWGGVLYALLRWSGVTGVAVSGGVLERLEQLADAARPWGSGLRWDRVVMAPWDRDPLDFHSGWCNGTAGMIHLWAQAYESFGEPRFLELAERAAQGVVDEPGGAGQLCCGRPGQAYGLLTMYKHSGQKRWLTHAQTFAQQSISLPAHPEKALEATVRYSLYKGRLGSALLWADLEQPSGSCMPLFEAEGWAGAEPHRFGETLGATNAEDHT